MLSVRDIMIHHARIQKTLSERVQPPATFVVAVVWFLILFFVWFLWGAQDPTNTKSGPSSAHQLTLNGVSQASR